MKLMRLRRKPDPVKGMLAGLVGGLAGAWAMNKFQASWSKAMKNCAGTSGQPQAEADDATMKMAEWLLKSIAGIELKSEQRKSAGSFMHYGFGGAMGGLYGALLEWRRKPGLIDGTLLGVILFAGADELMVPALGLSESTTKYPLSVHASALGAHLVYGLTTEEVRRKVRRLLLLF